MTAAPPSIEPIAPTIDSSDAIRGEPFSLEHLEQHARELARQFRVVERETQPEEFLGRIRDDARALREAHRTIAKAVNNGEPATVDAEWLLDNFSIVEEQLREIQEDLPRGYYHELPKVQDGRPRVYLLSLELIAHTDSALDEETLVRFLQAFQEISPLSIGETWAFPIMLRLALAENLRRIASQMLRNRECRQTAERLFKQGTELREIDFGALDGCAPLVLELLEKLEESGESDTARLRELERHLAEHGWQPEAIARVAHRRQAANQVSIGNVITSMRLISALDWVAFFEQTNLAEQALRQDPARAYVQMDAATRDQYRRAVEQLAKGSGTADQEVAQLAIDFARKAVERETPPPEQHVGFYLIGPGRRLLAGQLSYVPSLRERLQRFALDSPTAVYLGSLLLVTSGLLAALVWLLVAQGAGAGLIAVMTLLALLPASEIAVSLVNFVITHWLPPRTMPKLDFRDGVPGSHATLVVIPTLLSSTQDTDSLINRLELHYLANPEPALRFALLTDFTDATEPTLPSDEQLLQHAVAGIRSLNERYDSGGSGPFLLFHRARKWNACENRWMGWERKRGKLVELNRWLRGQQNGFDTIVGDESALLPEDGEPVVRFVITLDSDTLLPAGAARRLIGTLSHPLNRPQFNGNCVQSGYVLLQPRLGVNLASANRSNYSRLFVNSPGIDPYSTAASDVYQDLFGEGSFTGKGIYDLEAFERSLDGVFPENCILSHDLIEGCHARVGLVSDIELFDEFPGRYDAEAKRQHRWARGDWQLLPWMLPWIPSERGWIRNRLSWLSYWKIADNLRRSLVPIALVAFAAVGWVAYPAWAAVWSCSLLLAAGFSLLQQALNLILHWPRAANWLEYRQGWTTDLGRTGLQSVVLLSLLPHRAASMLDAIVRTLYRLTISRRRLLEWETAAAAERRLSRGRWFSLPLLWISPLLSLGLLLAMPATALPAAAGFLILWIIAPAVGQWLNHSLAGRRRELQPSERRYLRQTARRTWSYFERFVVADENWLPPDNFQEYPAEVVAHRVSPTNEGLFLLSALSAHEFGFLPLHQLALIWERNLTTWEGFDRLHGHFYNWYDTLTLKPLHPRYVSTVDSGNLAVAFITLRVGVDELRQARLFGVMQWEGVLDSAAVLREACQKLQPRGARLVSPPLDNLVASIDAIAACSDSPQTLLEWKARIEALQEQAQHLQLRTDDFVASRAFPWTDVPYLARSLGRLIQGLCDDFGTLLPWMRMLVDGNVSPQSRLQNVEPPWPLTAEAGKRAWKELLQSCEAAGTLQALADLPHNVEAPLAALKASWGNSPQQQAAFAWLDELRQAIEQGAAAARELDGRLAHIANRVETLAQEMDFTFLFNPQRKLFSIGFNIEDEQLDRSHYDMLASEARLASYFAIVKGDVDHRTWFKMGRGLVEAAGSVGLVSWAGTMFEYLMPQLFQREYQGSIIAESCRMAVARQRQYGRECGIPWGISESAFSALAANSDYHYKSFGVPGLGLKRGLAKDLVVSPYSTFLALEYDVEAAISNLHALAEEGAEGTWGFYDAVDYTRERLPADRRSLIVRCYMAHHEGMSLLALANLLHGGSVRRRFHAHPLGRAGELLLQERVPTVAPLVEPPPESNAINVMLPRNENELVSRRLKGYETAMPRTHLLSNGQYAVMMTNTGAGYSQYRNLAVTRWRSDSTRDHWGQFIYLRDVGSGKVWSATYQPTFARPDSYHVTYSIDKAEFHRRDGLIETSLEVTVSPEHSAELRHLRIMNHGSRPLQLEVTSYAEVVLAPPAADLAHPAFQKLFIETEYIPEETALLARRRPRDSQDAAWWGVHVVAQGAAGSGEVEYESSREQFLGRGHSLAAPLAMTAGRKLTGSTGAVLDPVFSLRTHVTVPPHESVSLAFTTAVAQSREEALVLADAYHDMRGVLRGFELAWAYNQVQLRHLHISAAKAHLYQRLASALLYADPAHRAPSDAIRANRLGQSGLWRFGISGDLPILLAHVTKPEHVDTVRELLTAQNYWRGHQFLVDVVVINDNPGSYLDALQEQLVALVNELHHRPDERPTGVTLLRGSQLSTDDQALLSAAASVVIHCSRGSLAKQLDPASQVERKSASADSSARMAMPAKIRQAADRPTPSLPFAKAHENGQPAMTAALLFDNGIGGFADLGREYQLTVSEHCRPQKPWSNVLANPHFGCLVTESGGGYTWAENSREFKLTTWSNDPLMDPPAEWIHLRDERSGELLRPMPQATGTSQHYQVTHGRGYSRFAVTFPGLQAETTLFVAADDPVKVIQIRLANQGSEERELSLYYFAEWVLGVTREQTQLHIVTDWNSVASALTARNAYHPELPSKQAFLHLSGTDLSWTGDRAEFLGRNGTPDEPAALTHHNLSGRTGAGLDPCGAVQTRIRLAAGEERKLVVLLGAADTSAEIQSLVARYGRPEQAAAELQRVQHQWAERLSTLQVKTPNEALDLLVNHWLLYQTIVCRLWARSAFYQSGGAYGFRDQLQDVMAVVYSQPELAREQLLRAAAHQFEEGDVQHWWHPPLNRGTRTRFSDDYLWLPLVTCHYIRVTGDESVLTELAPFLRSPPLEPHEHERYETPEQSPEVATLYHHCRRTLARAFRLGPHGLPLMGCGDWNDGMNKVGALGQGESVWVGWFLLVILQEFLPLMRARGDAREAEELATKAARLKESLENEAWDGEWYRRAYFDDGTPLGSATNDECQIDSIAQTWAVFAQANPERTAHAMEAVWQRLVRKEEGLVLLFAPAFDKTALDPGYIKGYVPGIRENGGQYTHPALWVIQAFAALGDATRAHEVFDLINPIHHAANFTDCERYQVEPYVVAADVYGIAPHIGRGGWTWYTGSAAWMYRVAIESLLGFQLRGNRLTIKPCVPPDWPEFELTYRFGSATYHIRVMRPGAKSVEPREIRLDDVTLSSRDIELVDDGRRHEVVIGDHSIGANGRTKGLRPANAEPQLTNDQHTGITST